MKKCQFCDKSFKTPGGLGIHLTNAHKEISSEEYYIKFINPAQNGKCKFCEDPAQFKGLSRGFLNICKSPSCVSKSFSPSSKEYKIKVDGLSESEYLKWIEEDSNRKREITLRTFKEQRKKDPDFDKKNSRYCKEFWMKKGHSEEESISMAYKETQKNRSKLKEMMSEDPDYMKGKTWTSENYWIDKGFTPVEARKIVSEKQSTFSLKKCIEKYGEMEGRKKWVDRQEKWLKTLDNKTDEEKLEILKKKVFNNKKYSEISQRLFFEIIENENIDKNKCFFALCNGEKDISDNKDTFKPDFIFENKIIEFFGDYWHANPSKFTDPNKKIRRGHKKYTPETIRKIDQYRLDFFKKSDYKVMVIWENDYVTNEEGTIQKCIEFLKN